MFRTIKTKLVAYTLIFLVLVIGLQIGINLSFADDYYREQKKEEMETAYKMLNDTKNFMEKKSIIKKIEDYEESKHLKFIIANEKLETIYDSRQKPADDTKYLSFSSKFNFKKRIDLFKKNAKAEPSNKMGGKGLIRLYGIVEDEGNTYYVVIRTSIKAINQTIHITNKFALYISIFTCVFGGIFAYICARKIAKPIEEIDKVATNIANQNFEIMATEYKSNDEIGRLAKNINKMSSQLKSDMDLLKGYNKKLEEDIEEKLRIDEMRKDFISNVSHELKTPLAIMSSYTEMLKDEGDNIEKDYYYDVLIDETHKMNKMIETLLNLSNMENGLKNMKIERIDLSNVLRKILEKTKILFKENQIVLIEKVDKDCIVNANTLYIEEVISNYLSNAIKYTQRGGKIEVSLQKNEKEVIFTVFNEGKAIKEKEMDKIWESFYQVEKSRKKDENNRVGLGLYIVKSIMEAHNGEYGVRNIRNGVEFYIIL